MIIALVKEQLDTGKEYRIEWANGKTATQMSCFMFGAFTKKHPLAIGDHVLAVANQKSLTYLPGRIIKSTNKRTTLQVDFCNGTTWVLSNKLLSCIATTLLDTTTGMFK